MVTAAGPLIGGVVATALGYGALFGTSIVCELAALALLLWLVKEPRRTRVAARAQHVSADPIEED